MLRRVFDQQALIVKVMIEFDCSMISIVDKIT